MHFEQKQETYENILEQQEANKSWHGVESERGIKLGILHELGEHKED